MFTIFYLIISIIFNIISDIKCYSKRVDLKSLVTQTIIMDLIFMVIICFEYFTR